jgi:hypothetical protein
MEYEPEGFLEKAGDVLGIPSGRAEGDLKRFRDFIEERGAQTAGWSRRIEPEESSESISPAIQAEQSPIVEATQPEATLSPDRERVHFPEVTPADPKEATDPASWQAEERSTKLADESSSVTTNLVGAPDEPQFYRDAAFTATPTQEEIAERAYELYLKRGKAPGHELENWLQAEKELSEKLGATRSTGGT